jgi:hypothetical protein
MLNHLIRSCFPKARHPAPQSWARFSPSLRCTATIPPLAPFDGNTFLLWIREAEPIPTYASCITILVSSVEFRATEFGRKDAVWEELCDEAANTAGGGVYSCIFEAAGLGEEEVVDCCWGCRRVACGSKLCFKFRRGG